MLGRAILFVSNQSLYPTCLFGVLVSVVTYPVGFFFQGLGEGFSFELLIAEGVARCLAQGGACLL